VIDTRGKFDLPMFYAALDSVRRSRKITWKQVAEETGVAASTLTRMSQGKRPDVDTLAALADWSGLNPAEYIKMAPSSALSEGRIEPLAIISSYHQKSGYITYIVFYILSQNVQFVYLCCERACNRPRMRFSCC